MTTMVLAHRGASQLAPENTMPAFQLAAESGAEAIETDVQLTKDNVPILFHDIKIERTTNGFGYVKDYTFHQLKFLDAGSWFSEKYKGLSIVSLEQFFQWVKPKPLYLNIELKNNKIEYGNIEAIVYNMLEQFQLLHRTTISTFNANSIQRLTEYKQPLKIAWLISKRKRNIFQFAKEHNLDEIHVHYRLLNRKLVKLCQNNGLTLKVYTINQQKQMLKCFKYRCDGIFTDVPHEAVQVRKQYAKKYN